MKNTLLISRKDGFAKTCLLSSPFGVVHYTSAESSKRHISSSRNAGNRSRSCLFYLIVLFCRRLDNNLAPERRTDQRPNGLCKLLRVLHRNVIYANGKLTFHVPVTGENRGRKYANLFSQTTQDITCLADKFRYARLEVSYLSLPFP